MVRQGEAHVEHGERREERLTDSQCLINNLSVSRGISESSLYGSQDRAVISTPRLMGNTEARDKSLLRFLFQLRHTRNSSGLSFLQQRSDNYCGQVFLC